MVQIIKIYLRNALGQATFIPDQLYTILTIIEVIVNSCPLTYAYDDVEDLSYTIHLLTSFMDGEL